MTNPFANALIQRQNEFCRIASRVARSAPRERANARFGQRLMRLRAQMDGRKSEEQEHSDRAREAPPPPMGSLTLPMVSVDEPMRNAYRRPIAAPDIQSTGPASRRSLPFSLLKEARHAVRD